MGVKPYLALKRGKGNRLVGKEEEMKEQVDLLSDRICWKSWCFDVILPCLCTLCPRRIGFCTLKNRPPASTHIWANLKLFSGSRNEKICKEYLSLPFPVSILELYRLMQTYLQLSMGRHNVTGEMSEHLDLFRRRRIIVGSLLEVQSPWFCPQWDSDSVGLRWDLKSIFLKCGGAMVSTPESLTRPSSVKQQCW